MPTYERKCVSCGHEWEQEETVAGELPKVDYARLRNSASQCPKCLANGAIRLIVKTNFVLKGPRWAKDGYNG